MNPESDSLFDGMSESDGLHRESCRNRSKIAFTPNSASFFFPLPDPSSSSCTLRSDQHQNAADRK